MLSNLFLSLSTLCCDTILPETTQCTGVGTINIVLATAIFVIMVIIPFFAFKNNKLGDDIDEYTMYSIKKAYEIQLSNGQWNFMQEREYVENLFNERINFLILSFSLFVTAFASLDDRITQIILLLVGFVVTTPLSIVTVRAYKKLDIHLKIAFHLNQNNNPMTIVDQMVNNNFHGMSKIDRRVEQHWINRYNKLLGIILPKMICLLYLYGAGIMGILMLLGIIN